MFSCVLLPHHLFTNCSKHEHLNSIAIHDHQISRFCGAHNIRLLFRGWNRLCLHAACVNSVERVARIEKAKFCKDPSLETDTTAATLGGGKRVADKVAPVEMAKVQEANGDLEEQRRRYACQLVRE